jgi:diaminohydroxyphosphoribosylaminopyrimidine deaminase/5-amino-6-(5-phosphoribosylamino)uracil reductase
MHRLRASEAAILVGTHTALYDDPSLTTRYWPGKNPLRIVIDKQLSLPTTAKILNGDAPTIILNFLKEERKGNLHFSQRNEKDNLPDVLMKRLYDKGINSIIVEGGAALLQSFIDQGLWDEAIVISSKTGRIGQGIAAPHFPQAEMMDSQNIFSDEIILYKNLEEEIQANGIL